MNRFLYLCFVSVFFLYCQKDPKLPSISPPNVSHTLNVTSITATSATSGGQVLASGGAVILARGVCWSTSPNPTINNNVTNDIGGIGIFKSEIKGLSPATTYYSRAYATNSAGTAYGNQVSFTTLTGLPTVTTIVISNIASNSASSGGNITSSGISAIAARGVCWGTKPNPTIDSPKTVNGIGIGSFTSILTGLTPGSIYYIRAYATNSAGTAYGNQLSFTTLSIPSLTTTAVTNIAGITATSGGNIIGNGGAVVTARGICWSTNMSPTIADSKTSDGTGSGSFSSSLTGLTPGTPYYVRAYATNSVGTAYGNELTFTTFSVPTLTTTAASNITNATAVSGGNITNNGGAAVTARGVCWSTSINPTTANPKTTDGSGSGNFTSNITGLTTKTSYYVRAYAINSVGTSYGPNIQLTTN